MANIIDVDARDDDNGFIFPGGVPRLLDATLAIGTVVTKSGNNGVLLDTGTGDPIKEEGYHHQQSTSLLSAKMLLGKAKVGPKKQEGVWKGVYCGYAHVG